MSLKGHLVLRPPILIKKNLSFRIILLYTTLTEGKKLWNFLPTCFLLPFRGSYLLYTTLTEGKKLRHPIKPIEDNRIYTTLTEGKKLRHRIYTTLTEGKKLRHHLQKNIENSTLLGFLLKATHMHNMLEHLNPKKNGDKTIYKPIKKYKIISFLLTFTHTEFKKKDKKRK
ncbi:hypothetical protein ACJX0J_023517 [Zea mays]